jgi:hypothetical protein
MPKYTVVGFIDDSSATLYVASVLEGHLPTRDKSATENVLGCDLARYAGWVEAADPEEAEEVAGADVSGVNDSDED